jgi:hypothetical protein
MLATLPSWAVPLLRILGWCVIAFVILWEVSGYVLFGYWDLRKNIPNAPDIIPRTPPAISQIALLVGAPFTACVMDEPNEFDSLMP